jgi:DNA-binding NtrC family response regulator
MTAYSARELLAEAERLGVLRVLAKPFPLPTLIDLLEEAVAGSERILIVDDDADFLRSLSGLLQERGYQALQATDLPQAIAYLEHGAPGAVILDLKLDGAEPREAVLAIRTVSPAVMLILCSGHPSLLAETTAALPPGWYRAAITKPFDPELLLGILDELAHAS